VAFISIMQIAETATLRSDQPFLFADPPDHIPSPPLLLLSFPSGAYRLALRVIRLSEGKEDGSTRTNGSEKQKQTEKASARRNIRC